MYSHIATTNLPLDVNSAAFVIEQTTKRLLNSPTDVSWHFRKSHERKISGMIKYQQKQQHKLPAGNFLKKNLFEICLRFFIQYYD